MVNIGKSGQKSSNQISQGMAQSGNAIEATGSAIDSAISNITDMGSAAKNTSNTASGAFSNVAKTSDSMGASFAKNFKESEKSGKKFSDSIKTGITGAVDTGKKKFSTFVSDISSGAKKATNAILHPLDTIKSKFAKNMGEAAKDTKEVGKEADESGKDVEGLGSSGEKAGDKIKNGLGSAMKVLAAFAIAAAAITGIVKFTGAALDASAAANQVAYSFDKTFGDSSPDVLEWSDNFATAIHRNQTEVKEFLTSSKQMADQLGVTGEAGDMLAKSTTALSYDIGHFLKISDSDALDMMQDALTGNEDALSSLGVRLDETTLKQTAMSMGLTGNMEDMDDATLAQIRMNAILEQTSDIQQTASESIGGWSGGVKALQGVWTSFLENAGSKLEPMFDKIFGIILDLWPQIEPQLISFVELLANGFESAIPVIADLAENLLPVLFDIFGSLVPVISTIGEAVLPVLSSTLGTVGTALQPVIAFFAKLVEVVLPPLAKIFGILVDTLLPPLASLFEALTPILDLLSPALDIVSIAVGGVATIIAELIGWITKGVEKFGEFKDVIAGGLGKVGEFAGGMWEGAKSVFTGNASGTDDFQGGWTNIHEAGDELVIAKHGGGMAYLPQGSAVIPSSKTEELLSSDKTNNTADIIPFSHLKEVYESTVISQKTNQINQANTAPSNNVNNNVIDITSLLEKTDNPQKPKEPPEDPNSSDGDGSGGSGSRVLDAISAKPDKKDDPDDKDSPSTPREIVIRIIIEGDGSLSPEAEDRLLDRAEDVMRDVLKEESQNETTQLATQYGYAE